MTLRRAKQSRAGVPILNNVKEVSKKFLRCDEERILFKINSKIAQDPSKVSPNPPKTFPKSIQNRSERLPGAYLGPVLQKDCILNAQEPAKRRLRASKRRPRASQPPPKWSPRPSEIQFLHEVLACFFQLHDLIVFFSSFYRFPVNFYKLQTLKIMILHRENAYF